MRHQRVINHLGRTSAHRKAMLSNMASSLILNKRITTTTAKAKSLKTFVEPLITKSKEDSTHSRRVVFSYLQDKSAVSELFREISPKIADRPGGYTRILKIGNRIGDNAEMCILELVDYNEGMLSGAEAAKTKTTRRRRSSKKPAAEGTKTSGPVKGDAKKTGKKAQPPRPETQKDEGEKESEE
jgi:large subunit ribosomal protein L17